MKRILKSKNDKFKESVIRNIEANEDQTYTTLDQDLGSVKWRFVIKKESENKVYRIKTHNDLLPLNLNCLVLLYDNSFNLVKEEEKNAGIFLFEENSWARIMRGRYGGDNGYRSNIVFNMEDENGELIKNLKGYSLNQRKTSFKILLLDSKDLDDASTANNQISDTINTAILSKKTITFEKEE